ncbi:pyruvate oxidase [Sulfobacillus acidophilus TPY]|uniref:Pyruvate oxidase n=1 Tax=Sulfobacillus acidophilus (strain ATCC 700253 / DSM 10332 / NAL) TaxID=679936 RepID=G8TTZ4_SULAD|nr:pyruvate oxidase [Sulfobacillus acidophilus TPY]AEW04585.1 pyruvate oxidase [Sulfobacillus acidophilus DSM 10332]
MAKTVADVLLDVLVEHGVEYIFGIPGDSIDPLLEPLRRDRRIRFVQVRHEETGAFMASAYAKKTGRLGVCLGTAGPGAIHLLNGLYDAKLDHAPVLALTGQVNLAHLGTDYFQEVDLLQLFANVSVYNHQVTHPAQISVMADQACRTALAKRGVSHLSFPYEVPLFKAEGPGQRYTVINRALDTVPVAELLEHAAQRIDRAERPVILAGKGARGSRQALLRLAERAQIPIVNTLPGKGVVPDTHPLALGGLGLLGAKPAHTAMEECDLCLLVGTSYPYLEFLPKHAQIIQLDWEASQIGKRHQVDLGLVGAAEPTLTELALRVSERPPSAWVRGLQHQRRHWIDRIQAEARRQNRPDRPIHPQWVADRLSRLVDANANLAIDVGNSLVWMARNFVIQDHGWLVSAWLGSMGFGLPAAMAAKIAQPERQSVAAVGDGGFTMLMGDFVTAVKYHWPITVVVFSNQRLGMIKFEQEVHGMPEFGTELVNPDFAQYAEAAGGQGFRVTRQEEVEEAIWQALHADVPTIVDIRTDPNEKPLPPRITWQQARGYAEAWFKETLGT